MSTRQERFLAIDAAVFRVISDEDWRRAFARARAERNEVAERIRAVFGAASDKKILDPAFGVLATGRGGKSHTDL